MLLKSIQAKSYKSIADSGLVKFDPSVTCLVGKNESGKTAFLEAVYRLNPLATGHPGTYEGLRDYPRRIYSRDQDKIPATVVVEAVFTLSDDDVKEIETALVEGVWSSPEKVDTL